MENLVKHKKECSISRSNKIGILLSVLLAASACQPPSNSTKKAQNKNSLISSNGAIEDNDGSAEDLPLVHAVSGTSSCNLTGTLQVGIIRVQYEENGPLRTTASKMTNDINEYAQYLSTLSGNTTTVEPTFLGDVIIPKPAGGNSPIDSVRNFYQAVSRAMGQSIAGYPFLYFVSSTAPYVNAGGIASTGCNAQFGGSNLLILSDSTASSTASYRYVVHEFGHAFDFRHSRQTRSICSGNDPYSGSAGTNGISYNSKQLLIKGWLTPDEIHQFQSGTATFRVHPLGLGIGSGYRAILVPGGALISYRSRAGADRRIGETTASTPQAVVAHAGENCSDPQSIGHIVNSKILMIGNGLGLQPGQCGKLEGSNSTYIMFKSSQFSAQGVDVCVSTQGCDACESGGGTSSSSNSSSTNSSSSSSNSSTSSSRSSSSSSSTSTYTSSSSRNSSSSTSTTTSSSSTSSRSSTSSNSTSSSGGETPISYTLNPPRPYVPETNGIGFVINSGAALGCRQNGSIFEGQVRLRWTKPVNPVVTPSTLQPGCRLEYRIARYRWAPNNPSQTGWESIAILPYSSALNSFVDTEYRNCSSQNGQKYRIRTIVRCGTLDIDKWTSDDWYEFPILNR